ncbi:MAG TPA: outer membrane beta-barrel protein [Vicinamibacterales bacterium]|nr:outer membrane beta-barrel protein [Vicinamibacterales bacterium]
MIALVAVAMVLAAAPAFAQGAGQAQVNSGFGIGALGGFTWTQPSTDDVGVTEAKAGYVFGLWFGGNRDSRAGLGAEVNYLVKKVSLAGQDQKLTYLQVFVPFDVRFGYREKNKPNGYIVVGPNFDINFKAQSGDNSVDDVYGGLGIGLTVGAGVEAARVGAEVRYSWGLKNALQTDENIGTIGDVKFNTLSVVFKVRFN